MARREKIPGLGWAPLSERGGDLYEPLPVAVHALLRVEELPKAIWEPACAPGSTVRVLRAAGFRVYGSDLVNRGCPKSDDGIDFLMERPPPPYAVEAIVPNPPYKLAGDFVLHALEIGIIKVAMLLQLQFMESGRRSKILDDGLLARVYPFANRLPMMHRDGWDGRKTDRSAIAFAWFVWHAAHRGRVEIQRVTWEPAP